MGRAYRLAGAIVAETSGEHYLVGQTKQPCDYRAHGFEAPPEPPGGEASTRPFARLSPAREREGAGDAKLGGTCLEIDCEGEDLARMLADRFLIARNGSVSERLWRLVVGGGDPDAELPSDAVVDARWLGAMPSAIWAVVRDTVLRCT